MTTFRTRAVLAVLALSLVVASTGVAFAGDRGSHEKLAFPVAAATFKQHVEARTEERRVKMEAKIAEHNVPADKAAEIRARFAAGVVKVNAEVEKAVADGTVTKEEAMAVRQVVKEMRGHHGHGDKGKKGKGG